MLIRLYHNIYVYSEDLQSISFEKNHNLQKIYNNMIHSYYYKPKDEKMLDDDVSFSIFPYGTIFKV